MALQRSRTRWSAESIINDAEISIAVRLQRSRTRWSAERRFPAHAGLTGLVARLGVVVRRQHVVGEHIVDLAIPSVKLAVEVDGRSHIGRQAADARRDRKLARLGWRVLRLEAELVLREPEVAVECVRRAGGS